MIDRSWGISGERGGLDGKSLPSSVRHRSAREQPLPKSVWE